MIHLVVIEVLIILISMYMGKTIALPEKKERKLFKIALDIVLILILVVLAMGLIKYFL